MYYNISGGVANIFYQSCAQIDNNQQVYEAQIQVPRCNSILKAGSHQCQKLRPIHLDRCTGEHTNHSPKATHLIVCMLSFVWVRSCFWIGVSTPHQIFPHPLFLFTLYFIIITSYNVIMVMSALFLTNTPSWIFIVLAHRNNNPRAGRHVAPLCLCSYSLMLCA
jgi:hypothetical protein